MLIVEGPDGVGKTTLCRSLLEKLPGHVYAHFSRLPPDFDYYWGYLDRASRRVVQDRFHMSEVAYAIARGEQPRIDPETYRLVDARLRQLGAYTVLVTADQGLIESRWDPTQMYDLYRTLSAARQFDLIADHHSDWRPDFDCHFHCTETTPHVTQVAADRILNEYRRRQDRIDALAGGRPPSL